LFFLCCEFVFKGGGKHVGKQLESDGEEELHEGNDDEDRKGDKTEEILGCAPELTAFTASEDFPMKNFPLQTGRNADFRDEKLGAMPVVLGLVLDFFPHTGAEGSKRSWLAIVCGLEAVRRGGTRKRRNNNTRTRRRTRNNIKRRNTRNPGNASTGQHHSASCLALLSSMSTPFRAAEKKFKDRSLSPDLHTVLDLARADPAREHEVSSGRWLGSPDARSCIPAGLDAVALHSLPGALIPPIQP